MVSGINNKGQPIKSFTIENIRNHQSIERSIGGSQRSPEVIVKINEREQRAEVANEIEEIVLKIEQTKVFFAVTENEDIVIKIVDSEGKLIRQIPPEEYLKMVESLKNACKSIFKRVV
ncbi:MAG: flagellar protein FlaG [Thermodesulfovibrionales bacterium]|nr:flagellar protein FlaG [Thermodesulfovibrionales bacterium]